MAASTFFIPSVNVIGADSLNDAMNMMAEYGFRRTLIVTDSMLVAQESQVQAIKCDLCWHRDNGPACVEACPTHALQCVDAMQVQRQRLRQQPV